MSRAVVTRRTNWANREHAYVPGPVLVIPTCSNEDHKHSWDRSYPCVFCDGEKTANVHSVSITGSGLGPWATAALAALVGFPLLFAGIVKKADA